MRYDEQRADVEVLIEAVHQGSTVEVSNADLKTLVTEAVRAARPEGKVTVNVVVRAVHGGAKVVLK